MCDAFELGACDGLGAAARVEGPVAELDRTLVEAHARRDDDQLALLYRQLGCRLEADGDVDAACFFMTQAYVLALAVGSLEAASMWRFLRAHGRESGEFKPLAA